MDGSQLAGHALFPAGLLGMPSHYNEWGETGKAAL